MENCWSIRSEETLEERIKNECIFKICYSLNLKLFFYLFILPEMQDEAHNNVVDMELRSMII